MRVTKGDAAGGMAARGGTDGWTGRYNGVAMALHWLIAVLIIGNVLLAYGVDLFPEAEQRPAIDTHKSIGITVLGLVLLRILWRLSHRPPPLPRRFPAVERAGAHLAHLLLYLVILGLPISGWIHDSAFKNAAQTPLRLFGLVPWPRLGFIMDLPPAVKEQVHTVWFDIHVYLGYALYALLALHVLGALKHQFVDREPEFARMTPWGGPRG